MALPFKTTLPRKTLLVINFSTSLFSPVKDDSSTVITPSSTTPSAGILSPLDNITKSPTTTSSQNISSILSSLLTLHFILAVSSCIFSKAFSLPYSLNVEMSDANAIAITMPRVSNQSKLSNKKTVLTANTIKRILMIGSPKDSTNSLQNPLLFS